MLKKAIVYLVLTLVVLLASYVAVFAADGDVVLTTNCTRQIKLIDAAGANDNGVWVEASDFVWGLVQTSGSTTATVVIQGSTATTKPTPATSGYTISTLADAAANVVTTIGPGSTADASTDVKRGMPRWIKASVSGYSAGTITTMLVGRRASCL